MKTAPEQSWVGLEFEGDLRWELVQRIVESPHLAGSARLRDFLFHVTACAIRQMPEDATEQQIGIQVFQRPPGFNSSEDSIVRSQARLLRHKLAAYFRAEGASEPLVIDIPKGHYLPVFLSSRRMDLAGETSVENVEESNGVSHTVPAGVGRIKGRRRWLTVAGAGLALGLCLALVPMLRWQRHAAIVRPV